MRFNKQDRSVNHCKSILKKSMISAVSFGLLVSSGNGFAYDAYAADAHRYLLPVFETTDIHGYIAEKSGDDYLYLLSYISDKVKDVRGYGENYDKDAALLLDAGDIYQGNSMSNLLFGKPIFSAFAMMDYDAVSIGNHEFDWGINSVIDSDGTIMDSDFEGFETVNSVPVVASNIYLNNERAGWMKDHVIVTKNAADADGNVLPVRIGIIGYLDEYSNDILVSKFKDLGYSIDPDINIPEIIAKELEESGQVDATILLCHADAKMVADTLGSDSVIDLVLGGHSHKDENDVSANGIPYMEADKYASSYCSLDLAFYKEDDKVIFDSVCNATNHSVSDNALKTLHTAENSDEIDEDIALLTDKVISTIKSILEEKVGYITAPAKKKQYIEGSGKMSTTGGNWMSSVYQGAVGSEVAFTNRDAFRYDFELSPDSPKRDVTLGEIYSTYPFGNTLYKYSLTYEELLEVFNYGLMNENRSTISSVVGIDCYHENNAVNALVKDGVAIYLNGEWKDDWKDRTVTVGTSVYVATTDEVFNETHNPLIRFNDTDKVLENDKIDIDSAIEILKNEAASNDGLLTIDTAPHFIEGTYVDDNAEQAGDSSRVGLLSMILLTGLAIIILNGRKLHPVKVR